MPFEFNRRELAGSLGDLGTLLPLLIPLVVINGLNATVALLLIGLFYIGAGLYYKIPVPVQPLKAVAAIAIAGGFSASSIAMAGLVVGITMLILGITGVIHQIARVFSPPVIIGLQVGLGAVMVIAGIKLAVDSKLFANGGTASLYGVPVNIVAGLIGILIAVLLLKSKKLPAAIALIAFGFMVGLAFRRPELSLGPQLAAPPAPTMDDLRIALVVLVIPQIPLTLANAVISTSDLSKKYFKRKGSKATHRALATSIGVANLGAGALGGVPMCHGSGGMAAHYRFGARTGGSNLIIGGIFITLALLFGASAISILGLIPLSILGILLLFSGIQMIKMLGDVRGAGSFVVVSTVAGLSLFTNMTIAFVIGIVLYYILKWQAPRWQFL